MSLLIPPNKIRLLMHALAQCEGFYATNSLPQRANNPGDLEIGDLGNGLIDKKTVFSDLATGWDYLFQQVYLILSGQSGEYTPDMSWSVFGLKYSGGDQNYVDNLTSILNIKNKLSTIRFWLES